MSEQGPRDDIRPGDLFWDKDRCWCDGSDYLDLCYLVLSGDQEDTMFLYKCACFMWAGGSYCGAHIRKFTADEILKMEHVGNISQIKAFDE